MNPKTKDWKKAVDFFLKNWDKRESVVAAMACGSFITGNPSKHSDIDLHLILPESITWRERGNKRVNGILIEYFANPTKQIETYFKEDFEKKSLMAVTQFLTGKILFDKTGILTELKKRAQEYKEKKFPALDASTLELKKYALWDNLDNVQDSYERESPDFLYVYYNNLEEIYRSYASFLQYPLSGTAKVYETLTQERTRRKYLLEAFPDKRFVILFSKAINAQKKESMMKNFQALTQYALKMMGGFDIDGWKMNAPLSEGL